MNEIHPDVITCIGRWVLEPLGVYNCYSGVTTNQSEGFNTVLKRLQKWREAPLDSIVFSLYQLQNYYYNEIQRGLCQCGDYQLSAEFASCARDPTEVKLNESISPQSIVERVQSEGANVIEPAVATQCLEKKSTAKCLSSQTSRANLVLTEDRISFDPKLGVFIVKNSEGKHHAVTLFPKQTCTCPSTAECYHIISAKMSVGMQSKHGESVLNLSQLRRNTRSRKEKKSGRKRFVPTDINPAPDSIAAKSCFESTDDVIDVNDHHEGT